MTDHGALMQGMLAAVVVLLVIPAIVAGAALVWYLRGRRLRAGQSDAAL